MRTRPSLIGGTRAAVIDDQGHRVRLTVEISGNVLLAIVPVYETENGDAITAAGIASAASALAARSNRFDMRPSPGSFCSAVLAAAQE
jgi:hypothetical protein